MPLIGLCNIYSERFGPREYLPRFYLGNRKVTCKRKPQSSGPPSGDSAQYRIYHENEKGKPPKKDSPLLKYDITNNLRSQKPVIYSRYMQLGFVTGLLEISPILAKIDGPQYLV